jgi:hypothetical protein
MLVCGLVAAPAPAAAAGLTIKTTAGVPFDGEVAAIELESTEGVDCLGEAHDAHGTIHWGDGDESALSAGEISHEENPGLHVSGQHTYASAGKYHGTVKGKYVCLGASEQSFSASFTAEVAEAELEPPSPPPPPPPPPAVTASVTVSSVMPGRVVLSAAASVPVGASAARYSWNVTGGSEPDAVCQGNEPTLTVVSPRAMSATVSLTAVDAATGASTLASVALDIPAPTTRARIADSSGGGANDSSSTAAAGTARSRVARVSAHLPAAITPDFKLIATCTGSGVPLPLTSTYSAAVHLGGALVSNVGGGPPSSCREEDTQFGAADIEGCLGEVANLNELPGGLTIGLSKLLCGAKLESFCLPALSDEVGHAVSSFVSATGARPARVGNAGLSAHAALAVPAAAGLVEKSLAKSNLPFYFSTGAVRIDGLDVDPQAGFPIVIIPAADTVVALDARVYLHGVPLTVVPALVLHLPEFGGHLGELQLPKKVPIIGSLPFEGRISIDLHRAGTKLSNGDTCQFDCAAVAVHLGLPGVFTNAAGEGVSADAVLTADDQQGLQLSSFEAKLGEADLGGIGLSNLEFRYLHANDSLRGAATLDLGPVGDIGGSIEFVHGHFNGASLNYSAGDGPGIDLGGPLQIYLTELGGGFTVEPPVVEAHGEITGGPETLGCSLLGIDAEVVLHFEPEFALDANGTGSLLCQSVASEYFHIDGGGHIGLGAHIHIHFLVFALEGGFDFDAEPEKGNFQADANVAACIELYGEHCLTAEAVISNRGIGVCADLGFTHAGGGIQFPDNPIIFFDTCDIGKFRSLGFTTSVRGHGAAARGFTVPKGQKVALIGLPGSGGPPRATLTGPSGRTIRTPAAGYEKTGDHVVISDDKSATNETYFFINHPEAGVWRVTPEAGSPAITSIQQAGQLPPPHVKGRVERARGGRDRLVYRLNPIPGQQVAFAERQADGAFREIGAAKGRRGTIVFSPSPTLARARTIEAMVTEDGRPREDAVIARFHVARSVLPAPRRLALRRHGSTLRISFRPVPQAAGYGLGVRLSDGRRLFLRLTKGSHAVTVPSVPPSLGARVEAAALEPGVKLREGRHATAHLKPGPRPSVTRVTPQSS